MKCYVSEKIIEVLKKSPYILILLTLISFSGMGQQIGESSPISWNLPISHGTVVWENLTYFELVELLSEDETPGKSEPMKFAQERLVHISPETKGRWINLPNGDRLWKMGIRSEGSLSLGLLFSELSLPVGARIYVYSEDQQQHFGPFTSADNRLPGEILVTPPIFGDELVVEYYEPFSQRGKGSFYIQSVQHAFRSLRDIHADDVIPCMNYVQGQSETNDISSSVLMTIVDRGQRVATSTLINNLSGNTNPYILTSKSAVIGNPEGMVFLFDLTKDACSQNYNCNNTFACGSKLLALDVNGGTALLSLRNNITGNWPVYYSGWNAETNETSGEFTSIQHAQGLYQSISSFTGNLQEGEWKGHPARQISNWSYGGTAAASVGSPLFDSENRLVGVYIGGDLDCEGNGVDCFAPFSNSYPIFSSYLDPLNSGDSNVEGRYPVFSEEKEMSADSFEIFFFPNPARDEIFTQILSKDLKLTAVRIVDTLGRSVFESVPESSTIDIRDLPEGLYLIQFFSGDKTNTQKLLVR